MWWHNIAVNQLCDWLNPTLLVGLLKTYECISNPTWENKNLRSKPNCLHSPSLWASLGWDTAEVRTVHWPIPPLLSWQTDKYMWKKHAEIFFNLNITQSTERNESDYLTPHPKVFWSLLVHFLYRSVSWTLIWKIFWKNIRFFNILKVFWTYFF